MPRFQVSLDDDPRHRWDHVVGHFRPSLQELVDATVGLVGTGALSSIATATLGLMARMNLVVFSSELEGIAAAAELPLGLVVAMQIVYEASAFCTSVVASEGSSPATLGRIPRKCSRCGREFHVAPEDPDTTSGRCAHAGQWHSSYADCSLVSCAVGLGAPRIGSCHWSCCFSTDPDPLGQCLKSGQHVPTLDADSGVPLHVRTMDWDLPVLRKFVADIAFTRKGVTVFRSVTWVGYVGVLTGMRPGGWSVSINYRRSGTLKHLLVNLAKGVSRAWPIGFLVRRVIEDEAEYDSAVGFLAASELMAPVYVNLAGCSPGQGATITRDRDGETRRWTLGANGPITQVNCDHWFNARQNSDAGDFEDIDHSLARVHTARGGLQSMSRVNETSLLGVLGRSPITWHETCYMATMCPARSHLEVRVWHPV